jgi:hypothetical protein
MKSYLLIKFLLVTTLSLSAQELTLKVDAPQSAEAGERFRIVYVVNSTDGQFTPPKFDVSFTVSGPQRSTSRNVQWINGQMTSVSSTTLIYYIVALTPGNYIIPPAQFETKKVTVSSEERQIEILPAGASPSQAPGQSTQSGQTGQTQASGSEVSLRLLLSTREVYVGEPITATLKLYTRINLSGINELKYPDFKGFLREDIKTPELRSLETEVIDGVQYGTGVLQRFVLYPQIPGEIRVDPVEITAMVQQRSNIRDPFFDDAFFDNFFSSVSTVPRKVTSRPELIRVKSLPDPRPADFHGAVGSFDMTSSLSKSEVEVNDAINLIINLKGTGNLNLAGEPVIHFPQGIEKYDPQVTVRNSGTATGTKTFEYLLIARNTGTFELPPVSYTVFDPQQEKFITLRTEGYTVTVTGKAGEPEATAPVYVPGEDVKYLGQDIRFIRNGNGKLSKIALPLVNMTYYWLWYALAVFIAALILILRRERLRRNADVAGLRNRKAARNARKRLSRATSLLGSGHTEQANAELAKTLWSYLGDKLSIPQSEITRERCYTLLRDKKVAEELISELDLILSSTEYSQYAPEKEGESPDALYRRTAALIGKLDNVLD